MPLGKQNDTISYIKGLAMMSAVSAHCNSIGWGNSVAEISSLILQNIGTIGVICFFILSGVLFHPTADRGVQYLRKKAASMLLPWCISGTAVFLYVYLRKPPITFSNYINFLLGNGSYLYYMSVLFLLYIIFGLFPFMRKKNTLIICVIVTIISTIWMYSPGGINPYMNVLNWSGYFALGILIQQHQNRVDIFLKRAFKYRVIVYSLYSAIIIWQVINERGGYYFNGINVVFCWVGAFSIILGGISVARRDGLISRNVQRLGVDSLFVYLWHMPIAGVTAFVMNIGALQNFVLLRPIIVCTVMLTALKVTSTVIEKTHMTRFGRVIGILTK